MALTLTEIITDTAQKAGIDTQNQVNMNNLIRWVNMTQDTVCQAYPWAFLHERTTLTSVVDTAGVAATNVAACTLASTTVTGTGTSFAATDVGRFIQFSSSNDWYKITARASTTSITLETGYAMATEADMTYTIRTFSYDLPTNMARVIDIRQFRSPAKLVPVDTRTFDSFQPLSSSTGNPRVYYVYSYNNSQSLTGQNYAVSFYPVPSVAMLLEVRYVRRPPQLSVGTDISVIPQIFANVLVTGTLVHVYQWMNSPNTGGQKKQFEQEIKDMLNKMPQTEDMDHVLQACDMSPGPGQVVPFPSQYGYPYSF